MSSSFLTSLDGKPRWLRVLRVLPVLLVGLVPLCGYPGYTAYEAVTAERATAVVEWCDRHGHCHGSWWLADGRRFTGEIEYANSDDRGPRIDVWATPRSATVDRFGWWLIVTLNVIAWMIGLPLSVFFIRRASAAAKARKSRPSTDQVLA